MPAIFFVDGDIGNDAGFGTELEPFATIQRGIQAAALNDGDDIVIVQPADLGYSENLSINDSSGTLIIQGSTGTASDVTIHGLGQTVITIGLTNDVILEDLQVTGGSTGIDAFGDANLFLNNVEAIGNAVGLSVASANLLVVTGGAYSNNTDDGIVLGNVDASVNIATLTDVIVEGNGDIGLEGVAVSTLTVLDGSVSDNGADDNSNNAHGIAVRSDNVATTVTLTDVVVNGNGGIGALIVGAASVSITGGTFSDNGSDGLQLGFPPDSSAGPVTLTNVSANSNGESGLHVIMVDSLTISGGSFSNNGGEGIVSGAAGGILPIGNVNISDVIAAGNGGTAVLIPFADSVTISGGDFSSNGGDGVQLGSAALQTSPGPVSVENVIAGTNAGHGLSVALATFVTLAGGNFSDNTADGINLSAVGAVIALDVTAERNAGIAGLRVLENNQEPVEITGGSFSDNAGDGLRLFDVGPVTLIGVTAVGNDPGVVVFNATSFSDTDGNYSNNADGGIVLTAIAGDVTLVRTTLLDNDADEDGSGDGFRALIDNETGGPAIGGNLLVQGVSIADTEADGLQQFGILVESIVGSVVFEDADNPEQSIIVTGHQQHGVLIEDGGTTATFTGGDFSNNGNSTTSDEPLHNIQLLSFSGDVLLTNVTADDSGQGDGLNVAGAGSVTVDGGSFSLNADTGIAIANAAGAINISNVAADDNGGNGMDMTNVGPVTLQNASASNNADTGVNMLTIGTSLGGDSLIVSGVTASNNGAEGIIVDGTVNGNVSMASVSANDNGAEGIVFFGAIDGLLNLLDVVANNNIEGVAAFGTVGGDVSLSNVTANLNDGEGIVFFDVISGDVALQSVMANQNLAEGIAFFGDITGQVAVSDAQASQNGAEGIAFFAFVGSVSFANVTANENGAEGIAFFESVGGSVAFNVVEASSNLIEGIAFSASIGGDVDFTSVIANNNGTRSNQVLTSQFAGIEIFGPVDGDVRFNLVEAVGNQGNLLADGYGLIVQRALSFSDTDSNYSSNDDGGIVLAGIIGDVTLVRTLLHDNDADEDGIGDGLLAEEPGGTDDPAIGGNLLVQGATITHSERPRVQQNGVVVESILGSVVFEDSDGPQQSVRVTGNLQHGVLILDGGTTATFINGDYSRNGQSETSDESENNIALFSFSGEVSLSNVVADSNALGSGLVVDDSGPVTINGGSFSGNMDDGIALSSVTGDVTITNVVADNNADALANGLSLSAVTGSVTVDGSSLSNNGGNGIISQDVSSTLNVVNTTASGNDANGLQADGVGVVAVQASSFSSNGLTGIAVTAIVDTVNLTNVTASDNAIGFDLMATVALEGNTLESNDIGIRMDNGAIVTFGPNNVILNDAASTSGLLISGSNVAVVGGTLNNTAFGVPILGGDVTVGGNFITLVNGALKGPGLLDATEATFNGTPGEALEPLDLAAVEDRLIHQPDNANVGRIILQTRKAFLENENMVVIGSKGRDVITINASDLTSGSATILDADFANPAGGSGFALDSTGRILVFGLDGNDLIQIIGGMAASVFGGEGNDRIYGSGADDILLGEGGNDFLRGYGGDDVLIGGLGVDLLVGDDGEDILVGGSTGDATTEELAQELVRWQTTRNLEELASFTTDVDDQLNFDRMLGGTGADAFLPRLGEDLPDHVVDLTGEDSVFPTGGQTFALGNLPGPGGISPIRANLPFADSFDSQEESALRREWVEQLGAFAQSGTAVALGQVNLATLHGIFVSNAAVEADVALTANVSYAGLVSRYRGVGDRDMYWGALVKRGNVVTAELWKNVGGRWTLLHSAAVAGTSGRLRLETVGTSLKLFFNGQLVSYANDSSLANGTVGIRGGASTSFDSFIAETITSLNATLPFADGFASTLGQNGLARQWSEKAGMFRLESNTARGSERLNIAVLNGVTASDVTVEAQVQLGSGVAHAGLVSRYRGSGDRDMYWAALVQRNGTNSAEIWKNVGGVWTLLASRKVNVNGGILRFSTVGSSLKLYFNDVLTVFAHDTSLTSGTVGMRGGLGASYAGFSAAAVTPSAPTLPFADSFDQADGRSPDAEWRESAGAFTVMDNQLTGMGTLNLAVLGGVNQSNVSVQARITLVGAGSYAGIVSHYQGSGDRNMYWAGLVDRAGTMRAELWRNVAGVWTLLDVQNVSTKQGILRLESIGTSLKFYLNDSLVGEATDGLLGPGSVGIRGSSATLVDDFSANTLG